MVEQAASRKLVYILARQTLWVNSRIFKQAKSLLSAGYDVKMVGIRTGELLPYEEKDGYTIFRVTPSPLPLRLRRLLDRLVGVAPASPDGPQRTATRRARRVFVRVGVLALVTLMRMVSRTRWLFYSWDYYTKAYKVVMSDERRPDVIHANDLHTLAVAWLLAVRLRAKLVYDAQELCVGMAGLPKWYRLLLFVQEFILIRFADKVIVVNHPIAEEMEKRYRIKVDDVILNCSPYVESAAPDDTLSIRGKLGIAPKTRVCLFSGSLARRRGIANCVLAMQYLDGAVLVILGQGELKEELQALIKQERLEDRVFFVDFVPYTEVPRLIASADVGIVATENASVNHYLSSPSKLFAYIMAELPIVCSDFPFFHRVVVDGGLGAVCDPDDPQSIAQAIESILTDAERHEQIKRNLAAAKREYCWENEEKKFLDVYAGLGIKEPQ